MLLNIGLVLRIDGCIFVFNRYLLMIISDWEMNIRLRFIEGVIGLIFILYIINEEIRIRIGIKLISKYGVYIFLYVFINY